VILQQGRGDYSGAEDTYISRWERERNYCTASVITAGYKQTHAALLRFDLSPIPPGAMVDEARLEVWAAGWGGGDITLGAYAVAREVSICQVTWNQARSDDPWALPGGNDTTSDRREAAESSLTTAGPRKWYAFDLTGLVQQWVNGIAPNNGVLLHAEFTPYDVFLASSESAQVSLRPKLVVTYRGRE
jgi:hypothetical protein